MANEFGIWPDYLRAHAQEQEANQFIIEIKKTPKGSAPKNIRKAWKGISLLAKSKTPADPEHDPLKDTPVVARFGFEVDRGCGIDSLRNSGKDNAASYYEKNWPRGVNFVFGSDEVKYQKA